MKKIIFLIGVYLSTATCLWASPSSLDHSFNSTGATTPLFPSQYINDIQAIAVQPDGKIVATGISGDNAIIVRYNTNGSLDTTFNRQGTTPGYITTNFGTQTAAYGIAVQPTDNRIVIVGYVVKNGVDNAFIARYNPDGSIDATFNSGSSNAGVVTTVFRSQSQLFGIALQANGTITVTGWAIYNGFTNALVARYTQNGTLDTTFNGTGYVTTLIGGVFTKANAIVIQADQKILITGQASINNNQQMIIMRYTHNGSLDMDSRVFEGKGYVQPLSSLLSSYGYAIALQPDRKILVAGSSNPYNIGFGSQYYTIVRLNVDGTIDTTFNPSGQLPGAIISNVGLQANGVVIQDNGQIVTCGYTYTNSYEVIVTRYNHDGTPDPSFHFTQPSNSSNVIGNAIALQLNGKIVVSGTISNL